VSSWETYDIDVCGDCQYAIAYSASEVHDAEEGWYDAFDAGVARETAEGFDLVSGGGESDELGYSWSSCDLCRLGIHGDRFRAHLMRQV
jgi:hypothetical protein